MSEKTGKIELWFFRDLVDEQRLKLFRLFGMPTDSLSTLGAQKIAINSILRSDAATIAALKAENERLREALEEISKQKKTDELETECDVEYADFEDGYDACIDRASAALTKQEG